LRVGVEGFRSAGGFRAIMNKESTPVNERLEGERMAEQSRGATRDYRALSTTPWKLWDVLYARRSHRKYLPGPASSEFAGRLQDTIDLATRVRGARTGSVRAVTEEMLVQDIKSACFKGAANKINIWLVRTSPTGFLLIDVLKEDMKADRPEVLPVAAMVAEDLVLWLAEMGLGTCWMAGVNQKALTSLVEAGEGSTIPVAIVIGEPVKKASAGYDSLMQAAQGKRRKAMSKVAYLETMSNRYDPSGVRPSGFDAPGPQDVRSLLEVMESGTASTGKEAAGDLVLDACFEAGRIAPSGGNMQPWAFIGVRDRKRVDAIERACGEDGWEMAVVVAATSPKIQSMLVDRPFWMLDGPISLSHISLMAASMGRSAGVFINGIDEAAIAGAVSTSPGLRIVGVVGIR
jgi:nitroreductase